MTSHGYPNYYPANAYVQWTFHYASGSNSTDAVYYITFWDVSLGYSDYLTIGPDSSDPIVSYGNYYSSQPNDLIIEVGNLSVEFSSDSYSQDTGFQLDVNVLYMSGIIITKREMHSSPLAE